MTSVSAFRLVTQPSDWLFAFVFPTTRWKFRTALAVGEFCHQFRDWAHYQGVVLRAFREHIETIERSHGLKVLRMPSMRTFAKSLRKPLHVVLFAHCDAGSRRIEFEEGMVSYEELLDCAPSEYHGIADFSVCDPVGLGDLAKKRWPRATVRTTAALLDPVGWLQYYGTFFSELCNGPCSYAEATTIASMRFRR